MGEDKQGEKKGEDKSSQYSRGLNIGLPLASISGGGGGTSFVFCRFILIIACICLLFLS